MSLTQNRFRSLVSTLAIVLALGLLSVASVSAQTASAKSKIKNFGQMDARFYRGAQPKEEDYKDLKALGIKTVIDLRDNPVSYERRDAEPLGIKHINIPMSDSTYPQ